MNIEQKTIHKQLNPTPVEKPITPVRTKRPTVSSAAAWKPLKVETGDRRSHLHYKLQDQAGMVGPFNFNGQGQVVRKETLDDVVFDDCLFEGSGKTWWGARLYEVLGLTLKDCKVFHTGVHPTPPSGQKTEGHGFYVNLLQYGRLIVQGCEFHDMQGNGLQVVNRDSESASQQSYPSPGGNIYVRDTIFRDCCQAEERGSFALAIYNPGQHVVIEGTRVVYTRFFPSFSYGMGPRFWSRGGILVGDAQNRSQRTNFVDIKHSRVLQFDPLHPALQAQGIEFLAVDGLDLRNPQGGERKIVIDEDVTNATLKNIRGKVDIMVRLASGKMVLAAHGTGKGSLSWTK